MKISPTEIPGLLLLDGPVFRDDRGHFLEVWNEARFAPLGLPTRFAQDNVSVSLPGVIRGLHYQHPNGQGKLVSVLQGAVYDVVVDIRVGSPAFGRWVAVTLAAGDGRGLFIPVGMAHGFAVVGDEPAVFLYKVTAPYDPKTEGTIRWDDLSLAIPWPVADPRLSPKDRAGALLSETPPDRLPTYDGLTTRPV